MNDRRVVAFLILATALAVGCRGGAAAPGTGILVTIENSDGVATPQKVAVTWVGDGRVLAQDRQVPASGTIHAQGTHLGTLSIALPDSADQASRTIVVSGLIDDQTVSQGAVRVRITAGVQTAVTLRLTAGLLADADQDGIPDIVDNCPATKNPGQEACPAQGDAGRDAAGPRDGMGAGAADVAPGVVPDGASDPRMEAAPPTDAKLPNGRPCAANEACGGGRCAESLAGKFCASPDMVVVPAGMFTRGCRPATDPNCRADEQPARSLLISAFEIDRTEVTQQAFDKCVRANVCPTPPTAFDPQGRPRYPVTNISWSMAQSYCQWAGKRLPTEAEWEKAARGADDARPYPWTGASPDCQRVQFSGCGLADVVPVGVLTGTSPFGAEDMAGNVSEWVSDWYAADFYGSAPSADPTGPTTGTMKIRRGGSFATDDVGLRVSARAAGDDANAMTHGFRCAKDL